MPGSPECGAGMEAGSGDNLPLPGPCTARFFLGLLLTGERISDEVLKPLAAAGCAVGAYDETGALTGAELTCRGCAMKNALKLDRAGGVGAIDRVPGRRTMADECKVSKDGVITAGQAVMICLGRSA